MGDLSAIFASLGLSPENVAITGGTINGVSVGVSTAGSGRFTSLKITSDCLDVGTSRTVTLSGAQTSAQKGLRVTNSYNGTTTTSDPALNDIFIDSDTFNAPGQTDYFRVYANVGSGASGVRTAVRAVVFVPGLTANKANGRLGFFVGAESGGGSNRNQGSTDLTPAGSYGGFFGGNDNVVFQPGATFWQQIVGREINIAVQAGASVNRKVGLQIVKTNIDKVQGVSEAALLISDQFGAVPWKRGLVFGFELSNFPFDSTSTLIAGVLPQNYLDAPPQAAWGVDLQQIDFVKGAFRSKGFSVDGSGSVQVGGGIVTSDANGMKLDASGKTGVLSSIAAGGTGYAVTDILLDAFGGVYRVVSTSGGGITGLAVYRAPQIAGATPSNPVALTNDPRTFGTGATVNLTWTAAPQITLAPGAGGSLVVPVANIGSYANDAAAAAASVPVGAFYHNSTVGALAQRRS